MNSQPDGLAQLSRQICKGNEDADLERKPHQQESASHCGWLLSRASVSSSAGRKISTAISESVMSTGAPKSMVALRNCIGPLSVWKRRGIASAAGSGFKRGGGAG